LKQSQQSKAKAIMKAILVHEYGDASKLSYEEVPMPEPKAGEVRVKVSAIGLNFADIYARRGWYPSQRPFIPGNEFAGTVDAVGDGVTEFKAGDRVGTGSGSGAYAGYALAPAARTAALSEQVSFEQAAALLLQGLTAHYLAVSTYALKPGDTALVHSAAGGVGQLLVQIAKKRGARVIGTVSTEAKARLAREAGADEVILYSQQDFEAEVKRLTGGKGVDVVYDGAGKDTFEKGLNCLKPRGLMALYGQASGRVEPIDPQILNRKGSLYLTRPTLAHFLQTREEFLGRANDLFSWAADESLRVRVDRTFPLAQAAAAQTYMEERRTMGKVLLVP
jgi:NADPH2:quinone reductase